MKYDFNRLKNDFMEITNLEEWDAVRKKYPEMKTSDMDHEMKQHMNKILGISAKKQGNSDIHYEIKKKQG